MVTENTADGPPGTGGRRARAGAAAAITRASGSQLAILIGFLGTVVLVVYAIQPLSLDPGNISTQSRAIAFATFVALGQMGAMIVGSIDLSVGATAGFCGIVSAVLFSTVGLDPYLSLVLAILTGTLIGLINGLLIARVGLNAFITTLAMQFVLSGGILVVTEGSPVLVRDERITWFGQGMVGMVPVPVIVVLIAAGLIWFMLARTRFGRHVYAVGGNEEAARLVGINTQRVKIAMMMLSGTLAATSGVLMMARLAGAQPTIGQSWVLPSFAGPILGGTSMAGGVGSVPGTMIGSLIMGWLQQGVVMAGLSVYWQGIVIGLVLIFAIVLDRVRTNRRRS